MSSAVTVIGSLSEDIGDPGIVSHVQQHLAAGCPLAPLVECLTPAYSTRDRASVTAAMVERARAMIAQQNELAANDPGIDSHEKELPAKPARGRPKSEKRAALQAVAHVKGVSESTVRRDLAKVEPQEEPAPPTLEKRLRDLISTCKTTHAALGAEIEREEWKPWKNTTYALQGAHERALGVVDQAEKALWLLQDAKRAIATTDRDSFKASGRIKGAQAAKERRQQRWEEQAPERVDRATNAALGPDAHVCSGTPCTAFPGCTKAERIASGGGLKPPKRIVVQDPDGNVLAEGEPSGIPPVEEVAAAWADGDDLWGPGGDVE